MVTAKKALRPYATKEREGREGLVFTATKKNDTPSAGDGKEKQENSDDNCIQIEDLTRKNSLKHNRKRTRLKKKIPLISSLQEDIVETRKLLTERLPSLQNYFFL